MHEFSTPTSSLALYQLLAAAPDGPPQKIRGIVRDSVDVNWRPPAQPQLPGFGIAGGSTPPRRVKLPTPEGMTDFVVTSPTTAYAYEGQGVVSKVESSSDGVTGTTDIQIDLRPAVVQGDDDLSSLLPIALTTEQEPRVNARDLHAFLEVGKDFSTWINDRIKLAGFVKNEDYNVCSPISGSKECGVKQGRGGHNTKDYWLTLDMAKELAMLERNDQGKRARRYFIACEKQLRAGGRPFDLNNVQDLRLLVNQTATRLADALEENKELETNLDLAELRADEHRAEAEALAKQKAREARAINLTTWLKNTWTFHGHGQNIGMQTLRALGVLRRQWVNGRCC